MKVLTPADVSAGLPASAAAAALLGKAGATALLILLFLAVTSGSLYPYFRFLDRFIDQISLNHRCLLCRTHRRLLHLDLRRLQGVHQPQGNRGTDSASRTCGCRILRRSLRCRWNHLLLYRYLNGLAIRAQYSSRLKIVIYMNHEQEFMGVVLGSAVVPIALCVSWKKTNKWGSIGGAVAGFCAGIIAWLVTTSSLNGSVINVTVCSTGHLSYCIL